ncbi:uncharacterized protein AMSG_05595 [Thecamonas trahens ATCC 50062]|uniref:Anaphase-promoting complex subunit 4 n=1 Tax=Thecamonas trahens ATCC 50062 TaxID=461836 RepID=A0A0L0DB60_THETB|nr:hypothetical protein AMSG_05595 [Thecamonas trahens ATCC 50062]KNC49559.1 hypothetical protein AMSG_05595 [Thecamonas trahens ATCC 50062]|eukprot:XP_013757668.1 hypothetical protein AMSG_05595 [Thecamonas trahens ATCC 50062]
MAFSLIETKRVAGGLVSAAWCPTMDVLAVASEDGELWLHRLSWLRLLSMAHSAPVTVLGWAPSGTQLAVAGSDGSLLVLDIERGPAPLVALAAPGAPAVAVVEWRAWPGTSAAPLVARSRLDKLLPRPLALSEELEMLLGAGASDYVPPLGFPTPLAPPIPETRPLDVLVTGGTDGSLVLQAHAALVLARLEFSGSVVAASLGETPSAGVVVTLSDDGSFGLTSFSLVALTSVSLPLISQVAKTQFALRAMLAALHKSLSLAQAAWAEGISAYAGKMNEFEELLKAYASKSTIEDEFLGMLATGMASPAMLQFVTRTLGDSTIAKLSKTLVTACSRVATVTLHSLLPGIQRLLLLLAELSGALEASGGLPGLDGGHLTAMTHAAGTFKLKLEELLLAVEDMGANFHAFLHWLSIVCCKLSDQPLSPELAAHPPDIQLVASFLARDMMHHRVSLLLGEAAMPVPEFPATTLTETQLPFVRLCPANASLPLGLALEELMAFDLAAGLAPAVADSARLTPPVVLAADGEESYSFVSTFNHESGRHLLVAWAPTTSPDLVALSFAPGLGSAGYTVVSLPGVPVAVEVYNSSSLGVLIQIDDDDGRELALIDFDECEWSPLALGADRRDDDDDELVVDAGVPLIPYLAALAAGSELAEETRRRRLADATGYLLAVSGRPP